MAEPSERDVERLQKSAVIEKVKLDELRVDRSYQRDPSQSLVDDIAENWDEISSELLLVSNRGKREDGSGGKWIVNGQHRSLGAKKRGVEEVWAKVIDLSEFDDPAQLEATFRLRTNVRMGDKSLEKFKAKLRSGDPQSVAIVKLLEEFGTEINETPVQETGINAVAGVEKLYKINDGALLRETLQAIKDAFGYVGGKNASAAMIAGTAWFILKHSEEADRARFIERIQNAGIAAIDRRARTIGSTMGGTLWLNTYRAFVDFYNERISEGRKLQWKQGGASGFKGASGRWGRGGGGNDPPMTCDICNISESDMEGLPCCFLCFYTGRYFKSVLSSDERSNLLPRLHDLEQVARVEVFHQAAGVFALIVQLKDGRLVVPGVAIPADDGGYVVMSAIPTVDQKWGVGVVRNDEDTSVLPDAFDDEGLVSAITQMTQFDSMMT